MAHKFLVLGLLIVATQLVLSRENSPNGPSHPKTIDAGRLVSMEKLPEMGEFCETDPAIANPKHEQVLMAQLEQRQDMRTASLSSKLAGSPGSPAADTQDRSKLKPIRWILRLASIHLNLLLRLSGGSCSSVCAWLSKLFKTVEADNLRRLFSFAAATEGKD